MFEENEKSEYETETEGNTDTEETQKTRSHKTKKTRNVSKRTANQAQTATSHVVPPAQPGSVQLQCSDQSALIDKMDRMAAEIQHCPKRVNRTS